MKTFKLIVCAALSVIIAASCSNPSLTLTPGSTGGASAQAEASQAGVKVVGIPEPIPAELAGAYEFYAPKTEADLIADTNYGYVIVRTGQDFDPSTLEQMGATIVSSIDMPSGKAWYVKKDGDVLSFLARLERVPGVAYAQPDKKLYTSALPNDPQVQNGSQYSLGITAWNYADDNYGFGANTPYVAIIDTGINATHEEFAGLIEYAKSAFDRNPDGSFEFVGNYEDFVDVPLTENWDDEAHGSHVAGTIAALGNNGKGVAGVCWQSRLISYKCFAEADGSGSDWAVYGSLYDLTEWKIDEAVTTTIPVNMSLGGTGAGFFELEMINYAYANDIVIIAAMGNDGTRTAHYPAAYAGVIAVGATNGRDEKVHFSMPGPHISVSAPGYDIVSTGNASNSDYQWMSGTSMAAPFVTGLVAYMLTYEPNLSPTEIKSILEQSADDLGPSGWDEDFGYGRVNVDAAIARTIAGTFTDDYDGGAITVNVLNTSVPASPTPIDGATVYLYDEYDNFIALGVSNYDGEVVFNGLWPYDAWKAKVNNQGTLEIAEDIDNTSGSVSVDLEFDTILYRIQTVPNAAYNGGGDSTDSILDIYDATGALIDSYDSDYLDSYTLAVESGQDYFVRITAYEERGGNYGLYISTGAAISYINVTDPYRSGTTDFAEPNDTRGTAYAVSLDTAYPLYLVGTEADWFKFSVP